MKGLLVSSLLSFHLLSVSSQQQIILEINSSQTVTVNGESYVSPFLLGLTAYSEGGANLNDPTLCSQFHKDLGINVIGFGETLGYALFPPNQQDAIKCCNNTHDLQEYIDSGQAWARFKSTYVMLLSLSLKKERRGPAACPPSL